MLNSFTFLIPIVLTLSDINCQNDNQVVDKQQNRFDYNYFDLLINPLIESKKLFNLRLNKSMNWRTEEVWIKYIESSDDVFEELDIKTVRDVIHTRADGLISEGCISAVADVITGLKNKKIWANKLINSFGYLSTDVNIQGVRNSFGAYDQCLSIESDSQTNVPFVGQYCSLKYTIPLPLPPKPRRLSHKSQIFNFTGTPVEGTFLEELSRNAYAFYDRMSRTGVCIPSQCSQNEVQIFINSILKQSYSDISVVNCHTKPIDEYTPFQCTILYTIGFFFVLVILATILDLYINYMNYETPARGLAKLLFATILSFSALKNGKELLNTTTSSDNIDSITGIRILTMFWIISGHIYIMPIKERFINFEYFDSSTDFISIQLFYHGFVGMSSFFIISGMLITYHGLNRLIAKLGEINILQQILNRFFRIWPGFLLLLMVQFLYTHPVINAGPIYNELVTTSTCYKKLANDLLFLGNFDFHFDYPWCNISMHTWYLATDFQLFLFSFILTILLYKKPIIGIVLTTIITILSGLMMAVRTYIMDLNPTIYPANPNQMEFTIELITIHTKTDVYLAPYCIGVLLGYSLHKYKIVTISKTLNIFLWLLVIAVCCVSALIPYSLSDVVLTSKISVALYAGLCRIVWSLCIAWVIFACKHGYGGPINAFLSWKLFVPLSKLSFLIYLQHFSMILIRTFNIRQPTFFSHTEVFLEAISILVICIVVSIPAYLAIEAPMISLYQIYFGKVFDFAKIQIKPVSEGKTLSKLKVK